VQPELSELETAVGARFQNPELLVRALTHRSLANESSSGPQPIAGDNERLEFLGDAVLGLVIAEALFADHPGWSEGELTRVRSRLVSR
jgi:ribonuclease-3